MKSLNIEEHVGICIQSKDGFILERNPISVSTCGQFCEQCCVNKLKERHGDSFDEKMTGFQFVAKETTKENKVADFVVSVLGDKIATLVYPLDCELETAMQKYVHYNLTPSQKKILSLVLRGHKNQVIADRLFISKSTLKKHLNNIYRKIPESMRPR